MMAELYTWSTLMLKLSGPTMLVCLALMAGFMTYVNRKMPRPEEVILGYVRYYTRSKGHIGILTYILILSFVFFVFSLLGILVYYFLSR